jgi:hypothetical protein
MRSWSPPQPNASVIAKNSQHFLDIAALRSPFTATSGAVSTSSKIQTTSESGRSLEN